MNNNNTNNPQPPDRSVTLRWFDHGACPEEALASLVEQCRNPCGKGMTGPASMTTFVQGNAVDVRITPFHGLIDLDQDLYPVLTDARATNERVFSKAAFSLEDMGMDSGDKLSCLRGYIRFVQHNWALPGRCIGLSMYLVREIASLAYWKNWRFEFRLDQRDDALVLAVHFPGLQDMDFVINVLRENDREFNTHPLMREWLRFFRNIAREAAELWTVRIVVHERIARKIGCLDADDVVTTNEQMPPYLCR